MKVLILGASGMLGNAMIRVLAANSDLDITGTLRSDGARRFFDPTLRASLISGVDALDQDSLARLFDQRRPDVVINCIGLVKQLADADDPLVALPVNALLPHRLARMTALIGARLVHISTDCVFSGRRGLYTEDDDADALDLYGRSKLLGEVSSANAVTLRTSIIGHEINSRHGLVEWFLSQSGQVRGYTRAIFSGLPTAELSRVIGEYVLPRSDITGVYQVASSPISKHDLLQLVAQHYGKNITIKPDDGLVIDRSLIGDRFNQATGYQPPDWPGLVAAMNAFR